MGHIRILIADDHKLVRHGLRSLLFGAEDLEVVGEAGDGHEAVAEAERLTPDVVLMDVVMPGMDGAQATATIRARQPGVKILALSGSGVEIRIFSALRGGALGYVSKTSSKEELVEAIRLVYRGRTSMSRETTRRLLEKYEPAVSASEVLTRRESEILCLIARGLSNQEIADHLHVSEGTVRTHITHILDKLSVSNRVEATLCALRDGLTTLDECLEPTAQYNVP